MSERAERREPGVVVRAVEIRCASTSLVGDLAVPAGARGIVVFAHGSGSSRRSPRNRFVAGTLHQSGLATLLFDLLTAWEDAEDRLTAELRFDIPLLSGRLVETLDWASRTPAIPRLPFGCFGASTGAAAALVAAAKRPELVRAVVSRGGRPDLAASHLARVRAPTLLVVGALDHPVIRMNEEAFARLECEKKLEIVPGATHLFEEPGALEQVAALAREWFRAHLAGTARRGGVGRPS